MIENENKVKNLVMVTGGTGLVGNAIKLKCKNYSEYDFIFLSSKDADLSSMDETISVFEKYKPKIVIHLAACVGGLYKNMNNKVEMFEKNITINYNVVKCAYEYNVSKLVACLSTCIFPDKISEYPITEDMLHDGAPHDSNYTYAYAKRMLEVQCRAYRENFNRNFICVTPTNIYGPHDNFHLKDSHVIPGLIHKCYLTKQKNESFVVAGSGTPLRQFIYSEDLAILILWTLENYNDKESIILSVPENDEKSINYVATCIAREFNYENNIEFDINKTDGQYKKTADNSKLMNLIKSFNFTPIEEGIANSVNWFVNNYNICRK